MKNLRLVNINTTAFSEENLSIITDLSDTQIVDTIKPIVEAERNEIQDYSNDDLLIALIRTFGTCNYILEVNKASEITI